MILFFKMFCIIGHNHHVYTLNYDTLIYKNREKQHHCVWESYIYAYILLLVSIWKSVKLDYWLNIHPILVGCRLKSESLKHYFLTVPNRNSELIPKLGHSKKLLCCVFRHTFAGKWCFIKFLNFIKHFRKFMKSGGKINCGWLWPDYM